MRSAQGRDCRRTGEGLELLFSSKDLLKGGRKVTEDDSLRRNAILSAASAVFCAKGFEGTTTLEIATLARVSKRDLYRLFGSKQKILESVISDRLEGMVIPDSVIDPQTFDELLGHLRAFGRNFMTGLFEPSKIALYRLAIANAPHSTQISEAIRSGGVDPVRSSAQRLMGNCVRRGIVQGERAHLIALYFEIMIGQILLDILLGLRQIPDATEIRDRVDLAVEAFARLVK